MQIDEVRRLLDRPQQAAAWLARLGVVDTDRAHGNLVRIATSGVTLDLLGPMCDQFSRHLPRLSDPDMALNNLDRFVATARSPLALGALFERDREALPILLQIFSTSQDLSDLLITDRGSYDLLRKTAGQPVARDTLVEELASAVATRGDDREVMATLRRFKRRETLRICYGDLIDGQSIETVTEQISFLADAVIESALRHARKKLEAKRGVPRGAGGERARFVVLALGKLGGVELNYSSDIDLILLYDVDGTTDGDRRQTNVEFFAALARKMVRLLAETTEMGAAYRVDLRLRPQGKRGPIVSSWESAEHYYDVLGRTWERQAMIKARPVAGDLELGKAFLEDLQKWVYRRYLQRADITGIKALKRRIQQRVASAGADHREVKTGHGGIRDIEFVIQFLQLLNGGNRPKLRTGNTLTAIDRLEADGCLSHQERTCLEEGYRFLRKVEHRLQIMFAQQTHLLPDDDEELRKLAIRMGFVATRHQSALEAFQATYRNTTEANRRILDHLLLDAFGDEGETESEIDLVLDPDPSSELIRDVLGRHGFKNISTAYENVMALATERIAFLSTRRCRHFLASIAPRLLSAIAQTPDPDSTLVNLCKVSDSLGGKGLLWELFSFNRPMLRLYVELCSSSPFLSEILTSNPGMIDELMEGLVLDRLPSQQWLRRMLDELCRGAEDIEPILHSFKNTQQLRVGVRDILGKEDIQATNAALSDIAQACLARLTIRELQRMEQKFGTPTIGQGPGAGDGCEFVIVGMGKFGGREPNYHSDLDVIFLYEANGMTKTSRRSAQGKTTSNQHFFGEVGQRIIKTANALGPFGRLYEIDPRLRPTGRSGSLATSFGALSRYFSEGEGQLWERLALCKARVVFGTAAAAERAMETIHQITFGPKWRDEDAHEIYEMRLRMQETAADNNLKRGPGGIVDVEFIAQMLQLKHRGKPESIRTSGTIDSLTALSAAGHLAAADGEHLSTAYRFLRNVEARLRLMNTAARHDLPDKEDELVKLARLLGYRRSDDLLVDYRRSMQEVREHFDRLFGV